MPSSDETIQTNNLSFKLTKTKIQLNYEIQQQHYLYPLEANGNTN